MPLTLARLIGLKMACYGRKMTEKNYHDYCLSTMLAPTAEVIVRKMSPEKKGGRKKENNVYTPATHALCFPKQNGCF